MKLILKKMKKLKKIGTAVFVCSLSLKYPKRKIINVTGKIMDQSQIKYLGRKGFGYDPIFIPNNQKKTFGQFSKKKR